MARSDKYNCPYIGKNKEELESFCRENVKVNLKAKQAADATGILFASENRWGIDILKTAKNATKVVCTYQTDFVESYNVFYKDVADYILMPSQFCAEFLGALMVITCILEYQSMTLILQRKVFIKNILFRKEGKKALVVWPKTRILVELMLEKLCKSCMIRGLRCLLKLEAKIPLPVVTVEAIAKGGDFYFEDSSWYPHTTQELLEISDIVINFGSTTVEECVMHEVPLINFDVKPKTRHGNTKEWRVTHDYLL